MDKGKEYTAIAFHDSLPGGKASGVLAIVGSSLTFKSGSSTVVMPLDSLAVELGGAANRLIFFSSPLLPEWSLYTADRTILKALAAQTSSAEGRRAIMKLRRDALAIPCTIALIVLSTFLILWGLWSLRTPVVAWIAGKMPIAWEEAIGEKLFWAMRSDLHIIEDPQAVSALNEITAPLTRYVQEQKGFNPKVYISLDPTLNAFAAPGGFIVINSGIIVSADSAEEVLGVIAHELSHVSERHVIRGMVSSVGLYFIFSLLAGDATGIAAMLHQAAPFLLSMQYSRAQEREADSEAVQLLVATGTNPEGMVTMFEKLKREQQNTGIQSIGSYLSLASTHPGIEDRIAAIQRELIQTKQSPHTTKPRDLTKPFKTLHDRIGALSKEVK